MAGVIKGRPSYRVDVATDGPVAATPTGSPARLPTDIGDQPQDVSVGAGDATRCDDTAESLITSDADAEAAEEEVSPDGDTTTTEPSTPLPTPKPARTSPVFARKLRKSNGRTGSDATLPPNGVPQSRRISFRNFFRSPWFFFFGGLVLTWLCRGLATPKAVRPPIKPAKECSLDDLAEKYNEQDSCMWGNLAASIRLTIHGKQPNDPGVFLFVHQGGKRVDQLIRDVAKRTAECYGQPNGPLEMPLDAFRADSDYRNAIRQYKELTDNSHVVVIPLLNDIPGETAVALHTICDSHTPLVEDMIVFLSMKLPRSYGERSEITLETVEGDLRELWGHVLKQSQMEPLITRVTEQVVILQ